jgi:ADP-heptose:LPS heptosyltransferase
VSSPLADPQVRHVAVVRLRVGLGDLLCSVPALRALRAARPDVRVTMITWPEMAPVVARMAEIDELLPFPGVEGIPERPPDAAGWEPFVAAARGRRFDLALQMYGDRPAANTVTAALGARLVGGFAPTGWEPPPADRVRHLRYPLDAHEVDRHVRLLQHLGMPVDGPTGMAFPITAAEEAEHAGRLARHGLRAGRYAVLHPGASSPTRRWPAADYAAVGDALAADGWTVVVTGVAGERGISAEVTARMSAPAVDLTGATDLGGLAALLRDCVVLVGNDTGTAHLAAAVGARSVTVFLAGDPVRWAHRGPRHRAVAATVPCAPCPHLDCPIDFRCARSVRPRAVLAAARSLTEGAG